MLNECMNKMALKKANFSAFLSPLYIDPQTRDNGSGYFRAENIP